MGIVYKNILSCDFTGNEQITMSQGCRSFKQAMPNLSVTAQRRYLESGYQSIKSYVLLMPQRFKFSLARTYTIFDCFEQCRLRFISPTNKFIVSQGKLIRETNNESIQVHAL